MFLQLGMAIHSYNPRVFVLLVTSLIIMTEYRIETTQGGKDLFRLTVSKSPVHDHFYVFLDPG